MANGRSPPRRHSGFRNLCSTSRYVTYRGQSKKVKVNLDICKVPLNTNAFSKALRYGNTQFYLQTSHTCLYSPATEHHCRLAGTHFIVPRRVEGCVDQGGWLHTEIKCRPPGVEPGHGHPSQYKPGSAYVNVFDRYERATTIRQTASSSFKLTALC